MTNQDQGGKKYKQVPREWKQLMDSDTIRRTISRLSYEIVERDPDIRNLAIVGIRTGGELLAKRIQQRIQEIEKGPVGFGMIDITLYRDDLSQSMAQPTLRGTDLPFQITGSRIVLVDDVLYTGRTIRAALDAIIDFGRPRLVELCVLLDRGHRELPIRPDYVGKNVPTARNELVRVRLEEAGFRDGAYLIQRGE